MPNIAVKADSLLIKQMCRMISLPGDTSFRLVGYWLGGALRDTGWGEDFPQLADIGPVSHTMSGDFPLHRYMLDTFFEAVGRGEVKNNNLKGVTTRAVYKSRMSSILTPPKVELKYPLTNFQETVYPRLKNPVLEAKQRDILFSLIHGIYLNRERLHQQGRADDPHCQNKACRRENLVHDLEHIFCTCYKVRAAWNWTKRKVLDFLTDQGRPPDISNSDILLAKFSKGRQEDECTLLLGTYVELVNREVSLKQKELLVNTGIGTLKIKTEECKE